MSTGSRRSAKAAAKQTRVQDAAAHRARATAPAGQAETAAPVPLFYKDPAILRHPEHAGLRLRVGGNYGFTRNAAAIPLTGAEFAAAGRHYPIVFSDGTDPMPLAVVGVEPDTNLFLSPDGAWAEGVYVPAYVRRYPFIAVKPAADAAPILGFDRGSALFTSEPEAGASVAVFEADGTPTARTQEAMNFCHSYAEDHVATRAFGAALAEAGLLQQRSITLRFGDGTSGALNGFWQVDESAYRALSSERLGQFHAEGWLDLIVVHLASHFAWQALAERRPPVGTAA